MKKVLTSLVLVGLLAIPVIGLAVEPAPTIDIMKALKLIANWLFAILLVIAGISIIIAGYFFVTASGDPDKTKRARDFVLYAFIGVLVGFLAKGLVVLVKTIVGGAEIPWPF